MTIYKLSGKDYFYRIGKYDFIDLNVFFLTSYLKRMCACVCISNKGASKCFIPPKKN